MCFFFFSSRRRHTRFDCDWSSDVCSSDLLADALNAAKSDKTDDLVKALLANKFEGWNGTISFSRGEGPYWQQWTPPMLVTQYTTVEMPFTDVKIVYPPELKTGDWMPAKR